MDSTTTSILNGLLGVGRISQSEYGALKSHAENNARRGTNPLPHTLKVLIASRKLTKAEAKAFVNDEPCDE